LNILGHDGNTLGVNGAQVGILKQANKVSFGGFLKSKDCRSLKAQIVLEILSNLTNQTLEGELANQKISRLLVATNLTKSDSSWAVTVRLLDASSGRSRLASCFGGKLLTRSLSSGGFTSGLLGTGHFDDENDEDLFFVSELKSMSSMARPI
jgi:histone H3